MGNMIVGDDVSLEEIATTFDIVVLATGLSADRALGLPQHPQARVLGAGSLLRARRSCPQSDWGPNESLGKVIGVVGNGSVAIDFVRLLAKEFEALAGFEHNAATPERGRCKITKLHDMMGLALPRGSADHDVSLTAR